MYKLWKMNTIAFVLQLIIAGGIWSLTDGFSVFWRLIALVVVYACTGFVAMFFDSCGEIASEFVCAGCVVAAIASSHVANSHYEIMAALSVAACISIAKMLANRARTDGAKEDMWELFLAASPLGIGTVFGGALLLGSLI